VSRVRRVEQRVRDAAAVTAAGRFCQTLRVRDRLVQSHAAERHQARDRGDGHEREQEPHRTTGFRGNTVSKTENNKTKYCGARIVSKRGDGRRATFFVCVL